MQLNAKQRDALPGMPFDGFQAIRWAWQMAAALYYLHQKGFVHRNLKASNVLLAKNFDAMVSDLGPARQDQPNLKRFNPLYKRSPYERATAALTSQQVETLRHSAPEQVLGQDGNGSNSVYSVYTEATDIWAYGIFLVRLFSLAPVYPPEITPAALMEGIAQQSLRPQSVPNELLPHENMNEVIEGCLIADPRKRMRMKDIVIKLNDMVIELTRRRSSKNGGAAFTTNGGAARGQNLGW